MTSASGEVYSHMRLASFEQCPYQYELKYIDKRRESFEGIEAFMGRCVHEALAWLYEDARNDGRPTLDGALRAYDKAWRSGMSPRVRVIKRNDSEDAQRERGRDLLARHVGDGFRRNQLETVATEIRFKIRVGGRHLFSGVIDRLARGRDGSLRVVDFKTTSRPPTHLDTNTALQLRAYGIYVLAKHAGARVELRYEYLASGRSLSEPYSPALANATVGELSSKIEAVESASSFPARPSALCEWCGYNDACDAALRRAGSAGRTAGPRGSRVCPRCGSRLRERNGRRGPFLGCAAFPASRYTRDVD